MLWTNLKTVPSGSQEVPHSGRGQQGPVVVVAGHDQGRHEAHHLVVERLLLLFLYVPSILKSLHIH